MRDEPESLLAAAHAAHGRTLDAFVAGAAEGLERLANAAAGCLDSGGKLLAFGNGGSAALAQEIAAELVNRLARPRRPLGAIALAADGSVLTSIANDDEYSAVFARQIRALGRPGDLALALSTSGISPNVVRGLREARDMGLVTAGLLGGSGGEAAALCDHALIVASRETARVQEVHLFATHVLCARIETLLGLDDAGG